VGSSVRHVCRMDDLQVYWVVHCAFAVHAGSTRTLYSVIGSLFGVSSVKDLHFIIVEYDCAFLMRCDADVDAMPMRCCAVLRCCAVAMLCCAVLRCCDAVMLCCDH